MKSQKIRIFFLLLPFLFFVSAAIGGYISFSTAPLADMLIGHIGFFMNIQDGDWGAWWRQHNEHRILLARILFWLDHQLFHGIGAFLVVVNYILLLLVIISYFVVWREKFSSTRPMLGALLLCWLSLWIQHDNLTWGFQSQFILAQLLPFLSFYFLHKAKLETKTSSQWYAASALAGLLSLGSMANGVITLPLLTLMSALIRMQPGKTATLLIMSIIGGFLYFHDYSHPEHHGSLFHEIINNPLGVAEYTLAYIGLPFYYLLGKNQAATLLSMLFSASMILWSLRLAYKSLKSKNTLDIALLFFILYIGGTALGTAGGRLMFGFEQVLTSRYTTPSLMLWGAFAIIAIPKAEGSLKVRYESFFMASMILLVMAHSQFQTFTPQDERLYNWSMATLAMEMQVADRDQISHIFPNVPVGLQFSKRASERNIGVFGQTPYRDLKTQIGEKLKRKPEIKPLPSNHCYGFIDIAQKVPDTIQYLKIQGWAFENGHRPTKQKVWTVLDREGVVIGFVMTGIERLDVAKAISSDAKRSGYKGYILTRPAGQGVQILHQESGCTFNANLPAM